MNVAVPQSGSRHTKRRLSHHRSVLWPEAGKSLTRTSGRSLILEVSTPHSGQAPSVDDLDDDTHRVGIDSFELQDG